MELIVLAVITALSLALTLHTNLTARQERRELIAQLTAKDQDMLDRLMAKDLPEVKREQREPTPAEVSSRRRNDEKLQRQKHYEENAKLGGVEIKL